MRVLCGYIDLNTRICRSTHIYAVLWQHYRPHLYHTCTRRPCRPQGLCRAPTSRATWAGPSLTSRCTPTAQATASTASSNLPLLPGLGRPPALLLQQACQHPHRVHYFPQRVHILNITLVPHFSVQRCSTLPCSWLATTSTTSSSALAFWVAARAPTTALRLTASSSLEGG